MLQGSASLISEKEQFVRLWSHECLRIFHDRLIDDNDRLWFNHMLEEKVGSTELKCKAAYKSRGHEIRKIS